MHRFRRRYISDHIIHVNVVQMQGLIYLIYICAALYYSFEREAQKWLGLGRKEGRRQTGHWHLLDTFFARNGMAAGRSDDHSPLSCCHRQQAFICRDKVKNRSTNRILINLAEVSKFW